MDSVVSSQFGNRAVLDIPALQISSQKSSAIPSLQAPVLPSLNNSNLRPDYTFMPRAGPQPTFPASIGLPPGQMGFSEFGRRHHTAPTGPFYSPQGHQFNYVPYGNMMQPALFPQSQSVYPGNTNSFPGYVTAPHPGPVNIPYHSFGLPSQESSVVCELEYGRVMNIDLKGCVGEFRGIPPFLRTELMRAYSSHPYMKVKITHKNGEFHVFAAHNSRSRNPWHRKHEDDWDSESDTQYDDDYDDRFRDFRSELDSYSRRARPRKRRDKPRGIIEERSSYRFR